MGRVHCSARMRHGIHATGDIAMCVSRFPFVCFTTPQQLGCAKAGISLAVMDSAAGLTSENLVSALKVREGAWLKASSVAVQEKSIVVHGTSGFRDVFYC